MITQIKIKGTVLINTTYKVIIITFFASLLPGIAMADDSVPRQARDQIGITLSGYAETGVAASEDTVDNPLAEDYTYHKLNLAVSNGESADVRWRASAFYWKKEYETTDALNNTSRWVNASVMWPLMKSGESRLELAVPLTYKVKRYDVAGNNDYDLFRFGPELTWKAPEYSLGLSGGLSLYDHMVKEDDTAVFAAVSGTRKLLGDKLTLRSKITVEELNERSQDRLKDKNRIMAGAEYKPELSWIKQASVRAETGRQDSRDADEDDLVQDYKYREWNVQTKHEIWGQEAKVEYDQVRKDYIDSGLGFNSFSVANNWDIGSFGVGVAHKETMFSERDNDSYRKESVKADWSAVKRMDWKAGLAVGADFYRFYYGIGDKDRYSLSARAEKTIGPLAVGVEGSVKVTEYEAGGSRTNKGIRVSGEWKY